MALHRILRPVENWENKVIRCWSITPAVDNSLHLGNYRDPDFLTGLSRALGLLTHETDFTVHNITIPQFHEIGDVDPVTQVEEQPIIPVFGRCFVPILIAGDLPDLLQR